MNEAFADHVTNQAFALTLSRPMVVELFRVLRECDEKGFAHANGGCRGSEALHRRGLVIWQSQTAEECGHKGFRKDAVLPVMHMTLAGYLVAELCRQAGLVSEVAASDPLIEAVQAKLAARAKIDREQQEVAQKRHEEWLKQTIKIKPRAEQSND